MPNAPLKKRSYGYVSEPSSSNPKNNKLRERNAKILHYLLLPYFILKYIVVGFFRILAILFTGVGKGLKATGKNKTLRVVLIRGTILVVVVGFLSLAVLFMWAGKDLPDPDKLTDRQIAQSTKIYDRTGEHLLYEVFADEKRTLVNIEDIPKDVINGLIATEDTTFYEHKGVRPLSILRSLVNGAIGRGRLGSGASTITQQLVKNAILTDEHTITRKLKEIILAIRLEQKYTKDQILKIYFNEIPFGSTNYGIQSAAQSYFGKNVSDLTLAESATLAGFPKAPSKYLNDQDALKTRRDFVLARMFAEGYISEEQKNQAQAEPLTLQANYGEIKAPHFVLYVKEKLVEQYGEHMVDTGGLKVITTLDWDMQQKAEQIFKDDATKVLEEAGANNLSLVALDPKTGQVVTMIGSKDFYNKEIGGQYNVAISGKRQPGSSFKPIIYAAAFEKGYTPETILFDVVTNFAVSGKPYTPLNYDLKEHGPVSMRQALQGSLNIPAVKTLYLVGQKKGVEFAERLGYTTLSESEGTFGLSLVLGGGEVKLIEHVAAYGVFADNGVKQDTTCILKVENAQGDVLQEWKQKEGERVIEAPIAATLSNVLSDNEARAYMFGASSFLVLPNRPVAAKTGTTNNYKDAWTVGYTPSLVTGVWAGNSDNSAMKGGYGGNKVAGFVWNKFMTEALKDKPVEAFPTAPPNTAEKAVLRGSTGGTITLKIDKITGKLASSSTPENYIVERSYIPPHDILHYVEKDNPRGPVPTNPFSDLQYSIWEAAVQDWIARKRTENPNWEVSFEEPPTEYDNVHNLELIPTLTVVSPVADSILTSRQITTDIRVSAPRGVSKVTYKIDGVFVGVIDQHPFNLSYNAQNIDAGQHTLTIIVEDDVGNRYEESIPFTLNVPVEPPKAVFINFDNQIPQAGFPLLLFVQTFKQNQIKQVNLYYANTDKSNKQLIATLAQPEGTLNVLSATWTTSPGQGNWLLMAEVQKTDGTTSVTDEQTITVTF